jgi:uncharacterized protein YsxB (DUF464 family)
MIDIKVRKGKKIKITVDGHAGSGEIGRDVVCAAVSTLCLTMMRAATQVKLNGFEADLQDGHAEIVCKNTASARPYVHFMLSGFVMLAGMYPQYITLDKKNTDDVIGKE